MSTCIASCLYLIEPLCSCSLQGWAFLLLNWCLPRPGDGLLAGYSPFTSHPHAKHPTTCICKALAIFELPLGWASCHNQGKWFFCEPLWDWSCGFRTHLQIKITESPMKRVWGPWYESYLSGRYSLAFSTVLGPINSFQCCKQLSLNKTRAKDGPLLKEQRLWSMALWLNGIDNTSQDDSFTKTLRLISIGVLPRKYWAPYKSMEADWRRGGKDLGSDRLVPI